LLVHGSAATINSASYVARDGLAILHEYTERPVKFVYFELVGINQPTLLSQIDHEIAHLGLIRNGYRRLPGQERKHQGMERVATRNRPN